MNERCDVGIVAHAQNGIKASGATKSFDLKKGGEGGAPCVGVSIAPPHMTTVSRLI
jgi:hypothetical protein